MGQIKILTGKRFGRLTVDDFAWLNEQHHAVWKCICDCGKTCFVDGVLLRSNRTKSCGCLRRDSAVERGKKQVAMRPANEKKVRRAWNNMLWRCFDENSKNFSDYGGRGITVCDKWATSFAAFYEHVSTLPHFGEEGYSLDRIDNNGNYEPGNVRWAQMKTQSRNRRSNVVVEYNGEKICLKEAAERSGIKYMTLFQRYHRGWRGEKLFQSVKH